MKINLFLSTVFLPLFLTVYLAGNEKIDDFRANIEMEQKQILADKKRKLAALESQWVTKFGKANDTVQSEPAEIVKPFETTQAEKALQIRKEREMVELNKLREEQLKMQRERIAAVEQEKSNQITAHIDLSLQSMMIYKGDTLLYRWPVSTARRGYVTPVGTYRPQYLERMHYSKRYHNSPMPHSIFFRGNFAIHGTNYISRLGRRASHGCVRLHPKHARKLYTMVRKYGKKNTLIKITY